MKRSDSGKLGGERRSEKLSKEARKQIATKASHARWSGHEKGVLIASFEGEVTLGDLVLPCAVLSDGTRVFSERGLSAAFSHIRSGSEYKRKKKAPEGESLPVFINAKIERYLTQESLLQLKMPLRFRRLKEYGVPAIGINVELLPALCEAFLLARDTEVLTDAEARKAKAAEILLRGIARVGVIALVDEATGFQRVRDRDELSKILEAYISKELLPWAKRFPNEFYDHLFRLKGWKKLADSKRPQIVGKLTNDVVYMRMPDGVLRELEQLNPKNESGNRAKRHHQFLTEDVGNDHLQKHLLQVIALMKASDTWQGFVRLLNKAIPKPGDQLDLQLLEEE